MTVDPALLALAKPIEEDQPWPRPKCPRCDAGHIRFTDPNATEDHNSKKLRKHPGWDPDWISGTFVVDGQCENPECQQVVRGTGDYYVSYSDKREEEYPNFAYSSFYTISHLHPPILLMAVPQSAPEQVRDGVVRASRVLFADPGLSATAMRATVERFLTSEGVPSTDAHGTFQSAHKRIQNWLKSDSTRKSIADLLFAIKWLGNVGTHEDSDLTAIEVLVGASVLDEAFHRLFTGPDIDVRAQTINASRGVSR